MGNGHFRQGQNVISCTYSLYRVLDYVTDVFVALEQTLQRYFL